MRTAGVMPRCNPGFPRSNTEFVIRSEVLILLVGLVSALGLEPRTYRLKGWRL